MTMELEESILQTAFLEGPRDCNGLIKDASGVCTYPDGTKRTPYARILIRPAVLEVARRYAEMFSKGEAPQTDDPDIIAASAFLEGGMYCARDGSRRAEFLRLDEKCGG